MKQVKKSRLGGLTGAMCEDARRLRTRRVEEFTDLCNNLHSPNPRIQDRSYLKPEAEVKPAAQPVRPRRWTIATAVASVLLLITATYALKIYFPDGSRARLTYVQRLSVPARLLLSPAIGADGLHVFYLSNRDGGALGIWRQNGIRLHRERGSLRRRPSSRIHRRSGGAVRISRVG